MPVSPTVFKERRGGTRIKTVLENILFCTASAPSCFNSTLLKLSKENKLFIDIYSPLCIELEITAYRYMLLLNKGEILCGWLLSVHTCRCLNKTMDYELEWGAVHAVNYQPISLTNIDWLLNSLLASQSKNSGYLVQLPHTPMRVRVYVDIPATGESIHEFSCGNTTHSKPAYILCRLIVIGPVTLSPRSECHLFTSPAQTGTETPQATIL